MDENNDTPVVATVPESDTKTGDQAPAPEPVQRPKLSDEELLNVLEGRAQRIRTKLGLDKDTSASPPEASDLLQKAFLRTAAITDPEEQAEAIKTAKKWEMTVDQLVDDPDWQSKLERMRATKANELATSDVKGSGATAQASQTAEYWIAKGVPPSADQVPDRKTRATIARALVDNSKNGKKFYNE